MTHRSLGFSEKVFEEFLSRWVYTWAHVEHNGRYAEQCYFVPLTHGFLLKVYSSINYYTKESAPIGRDSIGLVVVEKEGFMRVGKPYPLIQRTPNWRQNFLQRLSEILASLPFMGTCKECGAKNTVLRMNPKTRSNFTACPNWPHTKKKQDTRKPRMKQMKLL